MLFRVWLEADPDYFCLIVAGDPATAAEEVARLHHDALGLPPIAMGETQTVRLCAVLGGLAPGDTWTFDVEVTPVLSANARLVKQ